ncbi:hypothetical protein P3339_07170 [Microbulbifer sp. MLAF003]|uniref:hypothetical protein n=1 Tax=Microbulbifer sp. MLAF003 TaxID=3032582 RepID=UPI0024ACDD9B|nr:hypothetical protein [Microbulbifer sp. MLAF003]WHI52538.1 hypothetical protein P3339_07170 [Microbulbifer sp. MLAF003]
MVKTTLSALIALTLAVAVAACGGAKEEQAMENQVENTPGPTQPEVAPSAPAPRPGSWFGSIAKAVASSVKVEV